MPQTNAGWQKDMVPVMATKHAIFSNLPKASTDKVRKIEPREPAID